MKFSCHERGTLKEKKLQTSLNLWDKSQGPNFGPCDYILGSSNEGSSLWKLAAGTCPSYTRVCRPLLSEVDKSKRSRADNFARAVISSLIAWIG